MITDVTSKRKNLPYRTLSCFIAVSFVFNVVLPPGYAQLIPQTLLNLPAPGMMVAPSPAFVPVLLKGMTIHPDNPLQFDFIIDSGNTDFKEDRIQTESERLVKYFLASMTIPKDDLWVNLSPYEKDRIIPDELGKTELGRDMLAQDYILKQLTASLMYPEKELGKEFWDKVYQKAKEKYGTTEIPVDTFNKVWILPETATVYEHGQTVYIVEAKLRVMLDSDYVAMNQGIGDRVQGIAKELNPKPQTPTPQVSTEIIREVILPEIEKEVNEGQNFAPLRQIYHSLILAKWYKETIKNSLLSKIYVDQKKIAGVNLDDATLKDQIYAQYMEAYKKGVFNYIKEDYDRLSDETIPRKYFSGGEELTKIPLEKTTTPVVESHNPQYVSRIEVAPQKSGASLVKRSSSPVTPREAEARIKGKLAPEYHRLVNDTHVQVAMAYEGDFDVVYHAGPPERIEIVRGEEFDQSSSLVLSDEERLLVSNTIEVMQQELADLNISSIDYKILHKRIERIGLLLKEDLEMEDFEKAFFSAIGQGRVDIVEMLLDHGIDVNLRNEESVEAPALVEAAAWTQVDILRLLLDRGASIDARSNTGVTALILSAAFEDNIAAVQLLIERGADLNISDNRGYDPLWWANDNGDVQLVELLKKTKRRQNDKDELARRKVFDGGSADNMIEAAQNGNIDQVRNFLEEGADPNASNEDGETPLIWASFRGAIDVVRLLIDRGADVNAGDKDNRTALLVSSYQPGHEDIVRLLLRNGAQVNVRTADSTEISKTDSPLADGYTGVTPLMMASLRGRAEVVRMLLYWGADARMGDSVGTTPLYLASMAGHADIVRLLLENGADIEAINKNGETSLMVATENGHLDVVTVLLANGADISHADFSGSTAMRLVDLSGHKGILTLFERVIRGEEIEDPHSSSPITPREAEARIKGKLAPEYHRLVNDTHVQVAMAYEGDFDVVYHAGPPESIEITRAKAGDQSVAINAYKESYDQIRANTAGVSEITEGQLHNSRVFLDASGQTKSFAERRENGVFGVTEVFFLPESETRSRMAAFQGELKELLGDKVYLVDADKLHMTTQGLEKLAMHEGKDAIDLNAQPYLDVRDRARSIETSAVKMQVSGVNWNTDMGIFWELRPYLKSQGDPVLQRRQRWGLGQPRPPHVTAAYFSKPLSGNEVNVLRELIAKYQAPTHFGDIQVDQLKVIAYEDFSFNSGYRVLETVDLKSSSGLPIATFDGEKLIVEDEQAYRILVRDLADYLRLFQTAAMADMNLEEGFNQWVEDPIAAARDNFHLLKDGERVSGIKIPGAIEGAENLFNQLLQIKVVPNVPNPTLAQLADPRSSEGRNYSSSPVEGKHHLSDAELKLLRELPHEIDSFVSRHGFDENRVRKQLRQIFERNQWWKTSLLLTEEDKTVIRQVEEQNFLAGPGTDSGHYMYREGYQDLKNKYDAVKSKVQSAVANEIDKIIEWVKASPKNFKGEEVHVLNSVGNDAKVVGRIDGAIAEKYGYIHETANIVFLTPEGRVLLQLRNKKNFDDHLAMYGGHLGVGESHIHAAVEEAKQELGLEELEETPIFVDYEGYNVSGDNNKERRSWFVTILTQGEYEKILKREKEAKALKASKSRAAYKQYLFDIQKQGKGGGEVVGTYELSFDELSQADSSENPGSPYENKSNRFLKIMDTFEGKPITIGAFFTPDSLDRLLSPENANLWSKIQEVANSEMRKTERTPDSFAQSSSAMTGSDRLLVVSGQKITSDKRRDTSGEVGGIDMNSIDLEREGAGVDIRFNAAQLQEIIDAGIDGFAPVIINITPLPSILPLLGMEPATKEERMDVSLR